MVPGKQPPSSSMQRHTGALSHDVLRQGPKAIAVSVLQLLALANAQEHLGGDTGARCQPNYTSTCRLGPFGASVSHGVTASESPLYMDLAGRAFFSLSHGVYKPAQLRHLSGVCLSIWHGSACQDSACTHVHLLLTCPS